MIYDYPEYYETTFSFRDLRGEVDFLKLTIDKCSGISVKNILEIGCGPASHARDIISLGFNYGGLDINSNMLDYAAYKNNDLREHMELYEADMRSFEFDKKYDFAFIMIGSLYVNGTEEMNSHFDSISKSLNSGSLYFLDWCIQFSDPEEFKNYNEFTIEKNGLRISSRFDIRLLDKESKMYEEIWTININDRGRHKKFEMIERNKAILPNEFKEFIYKRDDFEIVGWWKEWNFDKPVEINSEVIRPLVILRKK